MSGVCRVGEERMKKDSSHIKSGFSCSNQESQQMEKKKKKNLGGGGFISQTTNQMLPTVCIVHIICLVPEPHLSAFDTLSLPAWSGHDN